MTTQFEIKSQPPPYTHTCTHARLINVPRKPNLSCEFNGKLEILCSDFSCGESSLCILY